LGSKKVSEKNLIILFWSQIKDITSNVCSITKYYGMFQYCCVLLKDLLKLGYSRDLMAECLDRMLDLGPHRMDLHNSLLNTMLVDLDGLRRIDYLKSIPLDG
jgi:hypothetical protein